jgi:hypothetical protein
MVMLFGIAEEVVGNRVVDLLTVKKFKTLAFATRDTR